MRVVHLPTEIAGQMGNLCYGLRQAGIGAIGYNWFHSYIGYKKNIVNTDSYEVIKLLEPLTQHCDLFHFHNGNTLFPDFKDIPYLKGKGKKIVMHHWGNDTRTNKIVRELNPYALPPNYFSDEQIHEQLTFLSRYIDTAIVQDYEVVPHVKDYYKNVHVLPLTYDTKNIVPVYPLADKKIPVIIHAPTNREFKGTAYVEAAINALKTNTEFTYLIVEKMNYEQALQTYLSGDIIIDQILCGSYGMLSVEAMAMGKVAIAFVREDVRSKLPADLPIVIATPDTLYSVLHYLISNPEVRHEIGKKSRQYAEQYHSIESVASKLISIYQQL